MVNNTATEWGQNVPNQHSTTQLDVLIVSERPDHLRTIVAVLGASPARVSACFTVRQAQQIFARQTPDLVLCDEYLSDGTYRDLLLSARFGQNSPAFILLLHKGEWEEYLTAMRLGVMEVLRSPLQRSEVETVVRLSFELKEKQIEELPDDVPAASGLSAQDLVFEELLERAAAALGPRPTTVGASSGVAAVRRSGRARRDVA